MLKVVTVFFEDSVPIRREICKMSLPVNLFCSANEMESILICGHDSDLSGYYEGNTLYSSAYPDKLVIVYSGAGNPKLSKTDIESGRVCRLIRTIERSKDGINTEEWEKIYELIDGDNFTNHEIHPIQTDYLSSLSILCQGYLATNSKSIDPLVQKALDKMGWNSIDYAAIIHTDLADEESKTRPRSWWLEPFDIDCSETDAEIHRQIDKIHEQVKKEWSVPKHGEVCSCINELINALKNSTSIDDPTIVANAYLAISHRLTHE